MKFLNYLYQHINILSLDVVAGAVVSAMFFGRLLDVVIQASSLIVLALSVWIIYTIDHLRDAITIPRIASTDRHRFHQKHFRVIFAILLITAIADLILIWFLPSEILRAGLALGVTVATYLALQRYLKFLKEFFVACLYTLGILLPSISVVEADVLSIHYLTFGKFFVSALMNLLLFSLFDFQEDRRHQQHSFVTWFGPVSTRIFILSLGLVNIVSGLWLWQFDARIAMIFILMNVLLLTVLLLGRRVLTNNYYRILGDAVFFIPGLYFL